MENRLKMIKAIQEAIMDSLRVQPPEYELSLDWTDKDSTEPAQAPSSAPTTYAVGPCSSSAPPRGGKGSISVIQLLIEQPIS